MKTFLWKWMFCLVAAVGLTLSFSACSDDNDGDEKDANSENSENGEEVLSIVGTWLYEEGGDIPSKWSFSFKKDGTFIEKDQEYFQDEWEGEDEFGTYIYKEKQGTLVLIYEGGDEDTYKVKLQKNKLTLTDSENDTIEFLKQ